jgi:hypothetical protein
VYFHSRKCSYSTIAGLSGRRIPCYVTDSVVVFPDNDINCAIMAATGTQHTANTANTVATGSDTGTVDRMIEKAIQPFPRKRHNKPCR